MFTGLKNKKNYIKKAICNKQLQTITKKKDIVAVWIFVNKYKDKILKSTTKNQELKNVTKILKIDGLLKLTTKVRNRF